MKTQPARMINVLVVEDSPTVRDFLIHILHQDPDIQVVSTARDGQEAVQLVQRTKPTVITMDIHMPRMNGFEATRCIMATQPTPVIMVSGYWDPGDVEITFLAAEAGAQAVLPRPRGRGHAGFEASAKELVHMVKLLSEVNVIRRRPPFISAAAPVMAPPIPLPRAVADVRAIAVGASTGGPAVLRTLFSGLPQAFPVPILLVQHMASGFVQSFCAWLAQSTALSVQIARHGDTLRSGHIYIAPDGYHMGVADQGCVVLDREKPENGARPAVSALFRAVAKVFGKHAVGVLLTGMGKDGVEELKVLRDLGAVTIAQDKESAVVYGMPGAAIKHDAATYVLSPEGIADMLRRVVRDRNRRDMCMSFYDEQA